MKKRFLIVGLMLVPCLVSPASIHAEDTQAVPISYTVSAKIKVSCNGVISWMDVDVGQKMKMPDHLEKEGYQFVGWLNETTGKYWNFDDPIEADMSLKAVYKPIEGWVDPNKRDSSKNDAIQTKDSVNTALSSDTVRWMLIGSLAGFEILLVAYCKRKMEKD